MVYTRRFLPPTTTRITGLRDEKERKARTLLLMLFQKTISKNVFMVEWPRVDGKRMWHLIREKLRLFNCHNTGHFARECKFKGSKESSRQEAGKGQNYKPVQIEKEALMTIDEGQINWVEQTEDEELIIALNESLKLLLTAIKQEDIDDFLYVYGKDGPQPQSPSPTVSNASSIVFSICPSNDSDGELRAVSNESSTHYSTCQSNNSDVDLVVFGELPTPHSNTTSGPTPDSYVHVSQGPQGRPKPVKAWEFSNARTPQQNGVAERMNRTLIEAARTMLADSHLPTTFWAEAVNTACYTFNRLTLQVQEKFIDIIVANVRRSIPNVGFFYTLSEKIAYKETHSPRQAIFYTNIQVRFDIMTLRKELDALALKHFGPLSPPSADHDEESFSMQMYDECLELRYMINLVKVEVPRRQILHSKDSQCSSQTHQRSNHKDQQQCLLLAFYLNLNQGKSRSPEDGSWVIVLKGFIRNKKDERGVDLCRNKARLVLKDKTKEGQEHAAQAQTQPIPPPPPIPSTSPTPPPIPSTSPTPPPIPSTTPTPIPTATPPPPPIPSPTPPPIPTPTSPPPPPPETEPPTDEHTYEEQSPVHHHFSPSQAQAPSHMPTDDLLQTVPKLISRLDSLELDLKQTKLTMGNAIMIVLPGENKRNKEKGSSICSVKKLKKTKEQILQDEASLAEAINMRFLTKEERLSKSLDALLAQRIMAEEEELTSQQRKEKLQSYQRSMLVIELPRRETFAKKMVDFVNQRKKFFAEERAKAKRNKPMTQSQLKTYMMNYLKNQGSWKLNQLRNLKRNCEELFKQRLLKRLKEDKDDEAKDDEYQQRSCTKRRKTNRPEKGVNTPGSDENRLKLYDLMYKIVKVADTRVKD
ncbi:ribonuclease H-like domain-containing protein [Tanacetum coccineum]|uniref:Ribonuclease H-like domain-containing protein n=1 Tax=Tanacetum coccineum TaxID=301880 RepID=A0ABQ5J4I4_9ASTR